MAKKYELTEEFLHSSNGTRMFRIKALVNIPYHGVKRGELGGFIESVNNLSQQGNAWVMPNCHVFGDSEISGDVIVKNGAEIQDSHLSYDIVVSGIVKIKDSHLTGNRFRIEDEASLDDCEMRGEGVLIKDKAKLLGIFCDHQLENFEVSENASIVNTGDADTTLGGSNIKITGNARLTDVWNLIGDNITIQDDAVIEGKTTLHGNNIIVEDMAVVGENVTIHDNVHLSECAKVINTNVGDFLILKDASFNGDIEYDMYDLIKPKAPYTGK